MASILKMLDILNMSKKEFLVPDNPVVDVSYMTR